MYDKTKVSRLDKISFKTVITLVKKMGIFKLESYFDISQSVAKDRVEELFDMIDSIRENKNCIHIGKRGIDYNNFDYEKLTIYMDYIITIIGAYFLSLDESS